MENLNTSNLYYYIKYGLFLKNIENNNPFDLIIFEEFDNTELELKNMNFKTMKEFGYDFSISGFLSAQTKGYKNILIVLDKLNINYLIPFIKANQDKEFTIINLGVGVSSYTNKNIPELDDIGTLTNYDINIYEPYDLKSFFKMLIKPGKNYIRISNKELPIDLMGPDGEGISEGYITLTQSSISGDNGTLLIPGYMLPESLSAIQNFQDEQINYDGFLIFDYKFNLSSEIQESIRKTEKIIVILDQFNTSYEYFIKAILWDKGMFDTEIHFIYPKIDNITTNMNEFIFSQAEFDGNGIYDQIKNETNQ